MIRSYKKEDISKIVALEKENLLSSLEEDFYNKDLQNPLARHYVYQEKEEVIGFVSSLFDGSTLEILNLVIDKAYQSKGCGTKLLTTLFESLLPIGLSKVFLEVRESNEKAIRFYKKLGFQPIHIRKQYYANQENAIVMQKCYDDRLDMLHLEAILFSKKEGLKYTSEFKERYSLNYYDLFNHKISSLKDFPDEEYMMCVANWMDKDLFADFEISKTALMHTNAYLYQSLAKLQYPIQENNLEGFIEYTYQANLEYGEVYANKYASFCLEQIQAGKMRFFSFHKQEEILGSAIILEYFHSIFIFGLEVKETYRNQGIASSIMDACINYGKRIGKLEIYLEADLEDTPIEMYQKMNFSILEKYYEMLKVK